MSRPSRPLALLAPALVLLLVLAGPPAPASAAGLPCGDRAEGRTRCSRVLVPIDRTGVVEGRIGLSVRTVQLGRRRREARREAVLFLAGGPGQAATSLAADVAPVLAPLLRRRDLVAVDTRGTGRSSDLVVCPELETGAVSGISAPEAFRACAGRLGPAIDRYGTTDVVEDLEAVRVAGGYDRLLLVGVSYGTYVAQRYAAAHPDRTAGLVLDSVVDPVGEDPFSLATFRAIPAALRSACARGACRGVTGDVVRELGRARARLPVTADVDDGTGRRRPGTVDAGVLLSLVEAGDLDGFLRQALPAALRRAGDGDPAPLVRLARETGLLALPTDDEDPSAGPAAAGVISTGSYVATLCRDTRLPWTASTPTGPPRRAAALAALAALPPQRLAGWTPGDLVDQTPAGVCAEWPGTPEQPRVGPAPRVPTLLLSGEDDVRTSPEEARRVARRTPGAQLLSVPGAGHSLILRGRGCVAGALKAFADGDPVGRCRRPSAARPAVPLPPISPAGLGRTGADRARGVARASILDATRTVVLRSASDVIELFAEPEAVRVAGLRSGSATLTPKGALRLDRYGYVPGTAVATGDIGASRTIRVRVRGAGLRPGTYRIRNPLADPDIADELGLDPELTADLGQAVRRLLAPTRAR